MKIRQTINLTQTLLMHPLPPAPRTGRLHRFTAAMNRQARMRGYRAWPVFYYHLAALRWYPDDWFDLFQGRVFASYEEMVASPMGALLLH